MKIVINKFYNKIIYIATKFKYEQAAIAVWFIYIGYACRCPFINLLLLIKYKTFRYTHLGC